MYSSDEEEKNFPEILQQKENYGFKWNKLDFEDENPYVFHDSKLDLKKEKIFDLWENEFDIDKKVHINEQSQIHYECNNRCLPFLLRIENINGMIQKGRDLKRIHYFKPTAIGQTELIYEIFAKFEDKIYDYLKIEHNQLLDDGLIRLTCTQRLPQNKVTYFRNLIVCFERVEKVLHRKKEKYCLIARIIDGEILLPKKLYNSISE